MKKLQTILFVAALLFIGSCSHSSNNSNVQANAWQATINGQAKSGNYVTCYYEVSGDKGLVIALYEGSTASTTFIQLTLEGNAPADLTTGTFTLGSGVNDGGYIAGTTNYASTNGGSGSLVLTQFNLGTKKISGTFNFTGKNLMNSSDVVTVTSGSFTNLSITTI